MSQPYPPPQQQPSPYPQQSWSDPRAPIPEQTHLGSWAPQPAPAPYGAQPYGGHPQPPYAPPGPQGPEGPRPANTTGVAAVVLAIVGLLVSWIPLVGLLSVLLGLIAVVLGLIGWNRARQGRAGLALPVLGAAIGIVAIVVGVLSTVLVVRLIPLLEDTADARPATSDTAAPPGPRAPAAGQPPADEGTLPAPGTFTWDDGLSVEVSAPTAADFSDTACCPDGDDPGVAFEVTMVNGTSEVLEPYTLFATLTADGRPADQVFDSGNGFDSLTSSVPPGRRLTVTMAFDAPGGDLLLEFTSSERDPVFFSATL